jgi:hypothetical protein
MTAVITDIWWPSRNGADDQAGALNDWSRTSC